MRSLTQPIIVRVQGYAYGAGFNLALGGDFRIMASDAKMATPFIKRGLATGTNLLQQYVGVGKAIEMTLLGRARRGRGGAAAGPGQRGRGAGRA